MDREARELERPGADNILAFYEHRFGAICRDPRLMLAPLDDHLVHRGDGVFETIRFTERKVIHLDAHLRRLMPTPPPGCPHPAPAPSRNRDIVLASQGRRRTRRAISASCPDAAPADPASRLKERPQPSLYVAAYRVPVRTDAWYDKGPHCLPQRRAGQAPMFARLKTTNYLSAVFMTLEAMQKHMDVALTFDANDCLTEAAIAQRSRGRCQGRIGAPEFKNALVGKVATKAMELAKTFMPVEIRPIPQAELDSVRGDDDPSARRTNASADPFRGQAHRRACKHPALWPTSPRSSVRISPAARLLGEGINMGGGGPASSSRRASSHSKGFRVIESLFAAFLSADERGIVNREQ